MSKTTMRLTYDRQERMVFIFFKQ